MAGKGYRNCGSIHSPTSYNTATTNVKSLPSANDMELYQKAPSPFTTKPVPTDVMPVHPLKHLCFSSLRDTHGLSDDLLNEFFHFRHAKRFRRVLREAVIYSGVRQHHMKYEPVLDELLDVFHGNMPGLICGECDGLDDSCACDE